MKVISDRQVLISVRDRAYGETVIDRLISDTGQPRDVCYKAIDRAIANGLIYSGVSAHYPWLSEAGQRELAKHRRDDDVTRAESADT